ncbi:D-alanine--D-alanine ligase [bacterium]|nr:D-alanine--D-alanine ligase [bacterium]
MCEKKVLNVMVLFGGKSAEHEISILSARSVIGALKSQNYNIIPVGIARSGVWIIGEGAEKALEEGLVAEQKGNLSVSFGKGREAFSVISDDGTLEPLSVDIVFPVLHGTFGEDGTLQGFLEMLEIPYVGDGVAASAIGMDKSLIKDLWAKNGIPVLPSLTLRRIEVENDPESCVDRAMAEVGVPCFVKPPNAGSSVGISKAADRQELLQAILEAAKFDRKIMVEKACPSPRELEISVIGNDEPACGVPGEICYTSKFYDYKTKYEGEGDVRLLIPAPISEELKARIVDLAKKAWKAADLNGLGRIDFLCSKDGELYVNEVNTMPGFTQISMFPKLWEAAGMNYGELVSRLIELGFARYEDRARNLVKPD